MKNYETHQFLKPWLWDYWGHSSQKGWRFHLDCGDGHTTLNVLNAPQPPRAEKGRGGKQMWKAEGSRMSKNEFKYSFFFNYFCWFHQCYSFYFSFCFPTCYFGYFIDLFCFIVFPFVVFRRQLYIVLCKHGPTCFLKKGVNFSPTTVFRALRVPTPKGGTKSLPTGAHSVPPAVCPDKKLTLSKEGTGRSGKGRQRRIPRKTWKLHFASENNYQIRCVWKTCKKFRKKNIKL